MIFSGLGISLNLITGILVARILGAQGRGQLAAVLIIPNVAAFVFGFGASQALSFSISRNPKRVKELLGAWLLIISFVFILSAPILQVVVPHVLAAQSPATMSLARIWCFTLAFSLYGDVFSGVMLGDSRYLLFNVVRFLPVGISCALYIGLAVAGKLTLFSALIALAVGSVISLLVGSSAVLIRHRPVWPRQGIAGSTFWYGLRSHGNSIGTIANARLDLLILPAFLASATVGLYSVASNVSWIVVAIAGAISYIVLPQATRLGSHGAKTVFSALRWTFITAATLALVIALAARPVIDYAYGAAFDGSVIPLLVMLPGSVCYAAAYVVWAGLGSLNRPGRAAMSQIPGVAITIFGLLAFLGKGGLMAAALVSTIAYASVLILALVLLIRASGLTFRELVTGGLRARLLNTSPDRSVAAYRVE